MSLDTIRLSNLLRGDSTMKNTLCEATSKKFLTDQPHEHSAVCWSTSAEYYMNSENNTPMKSSVDCILRIQDCTRSINLEFEAYGNEVNRDTLVSRLMKIDTLIAELEKFKDEMTNTYHEAIKHNEDKC